MNNSISKWITIIGVMLLLFSCAPTRIAVPLKRGDKQLNAHLGGALIKYSGTSIPLPLTSITYAQGITNNTTAFGALHTTALIFGVVQTELGVCQNIWRSDSLRIGVTANPALNLMYDKWEGNFKLYPQVDFNVYKQITKHNDVIYAGCNNWFELAKYKAHGVKQQKHWLVSPYMGYLLNRTKWSFGLELKWLVPDVNNLPNAVDYIGINHKGAVGVYLSFSKKF